MGCAGIPLVEHYVVQDEFVNGIDHIELIGTSCARFFLYSDHTAPDGTKQRILTHQIIIPLSDLPLAIRKAVRFATRNGIDYMKGAAVRTYERLLS